jgi:hypothetical protein
MYELFAAVVYTAAKSFVSIQNKPKNPRGAVREDF